MSVEEYIYIYNFLHFSNETKHGGGIKYMRDKGNKKRVKDEDTKNTELQCSVALVHKLTTFSRRGKGCSGDRNRVTRTVVR